MSETTVSPADGSFKAYVARPESGTAAAVLVIQEIFGVNHVMRDICDGLAAEGFLAMCPDLFWRIEPGIELSDQSDKDLARAIELFGAFNEAKGVGDLIASLDHLRALEGCSGKVASLGYCLGGKLAYLMATRSDADCSVGYYGVGIESALAEATAITKPLMLHIAEHDTFVSKEAQRQISEALSRNFLVSIHSYTGMDHAFARIGGANCDKAAADRANARTLDFFHTYLRD